MPTPGKGEKKDDFIARCIPIVIDDGTAKDGAQANAICHSIWDEAKKGGSPMYVTSYEDLERRCLPSAEIRLEGGDKSPKITGYAAVFDVWADIGGWFKESIRKGAFAKTIKESDIRALVNHNEDFVLGRNKAKTLSLREDDKGLAVTIEPPSAVWAQDLMASMKRGDINQMSFGFEVNKAENDYDKNERVLTDVTLFDVSVVTFPAYPTTSAQVRTAFRKAEPQELDVKEWEELDRLVAKLKTGEALSAEESRAFHTYVPILSEPPAKHSETPAEPPAKHSGEDTRTTGPAWMNLVMEVDKLYAFYEQKKQEGEK